MCKYFKFFSILVFAMLTIFSMPCQAEKKTIAVIPFEDASGYSSKYVNVNAAEIMTEELTSALHQSGRYTVIERSQLDVVLKEMGFQMTGAVDPAKAVKAGKLLGAQYVVIGKVTLAKTTSSTDLLSLTSIIGSFRAKIVFNYRFVDVQTGEIKYVGNIKGSGSNKESRDMALYAACQKVSQNVLKDLIIDIKAKVVQVTDDLIYIDVGSNGGFIKGERLTIVRETEPIEINGEIVGMREINIGAAKVTEINDKYSVCKITKGNGAIQKGDIVKKMKK